jgi:hypothetical protein
MQTQVESRIIYKNEEEIAKAIKLVERLCGPATEVIKEYNALKVLSRIKPDRFLKDLREHGIEPIEQEYNKFIESEINKIGLRLPSAKDAIRRDATEAFKPFQEAYKNLIAVETSSFAECKLRFDELEIVDNKVIVPKVIKDQIRESLTYRFENETEEKIWEKLELLKKTWDETVRDLKKLGYPVKGMVHPFCHHNGGVISESVDDNTLYLRPDWFTFLIKFTREENRKSNPWLGN